MSFTEKTITVYDSEFLSGDGYLSVSTDKILMSAKRIHDDGIPLFFNEVEASGTGTAYAWNSTESKSVLSCSNLTAGKRVLQSKQRFNYQAAHAQKITMTGNFQGHQTGYTKRVCYGDDKNGVFFQSTATGYSFGILKNGSVTELVPETNWTYQWGTFPAVDWADRNITLDPLTIFIFVVDFEWLGSGTVRFGFHINGELIWAHAIHHSNIANNPYTQSPNLPIRCEIENDGTGAAGSIDFICQAVASSGGEVEVGSTKSISRGPSGYSTGNNSNIHPIISFRIKSTWPGAVVVPEYLSLLNNNNIQFRYGILLNPTVAGVDNAVWVPIAYTAIEYDISRDNTNTLSGGFELLSLEGDGRSGIVPVDTNAIIRPGFALSASGGLGAADEFVIFAENKSGSTTFWASVEIREST